MFWMRTGAVLGFLAVALGAFAAHGLESNLKASGAETSESSENPDPNAYPIERRLEVFETGAEYQMYHALAILGVGVAAATGRFRRGALNAAGVGFLAGILIFSGSLYLLALTGIRWLGAITPIGGVAFLFGWAALAFARPASTDAPTSEPR